MVRIILKTFCLIFITISSFCQSSKYFVKIYGKTSDGEGGNGVIQLSDGGYLIAGSKRKGAGDQDALLIKVDALGNEIWSQLYGDTMFWQSFLGVAQIGINKFIAMGNKFGGISYTKSDVFMAVIDSLGIVECMSNIGDTTKDNQMWHFDLTLDTNVISAGQIIDYDTATVLKTVANIIKSDSSCNIQWDNQYWNTPWDTAWTPLYWVEQATNGSMVFTGQYGYYSNLNQTWLYVLDQDTNVLLDAKYEIGEEEWGTCASYTVDNGYIVAGKFRPILGTPSSIKGFIFKVDSAGLMKWEKIINEPDGSDTGNSFISVGIPLNDGSYVATGAIAKKNDQNNTSVLLIKLDINGNELWRRTWDLIPDFTGCADEWGYDLKDSEDSGFVITGQTFNCDVIPPDTIHSDAFLIKTNCLGFTGPPVADFIYSIANDTVATFTNQSDSAGYFTWYFGDGDSLHATENDSFKSPVHSYPDTGNYTVTLIAGACGEYDTLVYVIAVCTQPQAGFTYGTFNDSVQFTNTGGAANNYLWDFGDGSTGEAASPVHVYADSGTYTVTLKAITCGDTSMVSAQVMISFTGMEKFVIKEQEMRIYPNPATGGFSVELYNPSFITPHSIFRVYSMTGELITGIPVKSGKTFMVHPHNA